jgi:fibronectin type 3 domain-containing protein
MKTLLLIVMLFSFVLCGCPQNTPTPTPPSVTLNWSDKDAPYIVSYQVFRSATPGGPYTLIATIPGSSLTAKDTNVSSGQTWYYVVAAVDSHGDVSQFSNEESFTVPLGGTNEFTVSNSHASAPPVIAGSERQ